MLCNSISKLLNGSRFEKDLNSSVLLTPLHAMIFPISDTRGTIKSVSYTSKADNYLNNATSSANYLGDTFNCEINTYYHDDGVASMALAEDVQWKNKPEWFNDSLINNLILDAEDKGLSLIENYLPIFFIVSRKKDAIWGPHRDTIPYRIHHAVRSKGCCIKFYNDDFSLNEIINFEEGKSYLLQVNKLHNVFCENDDLRIHIVLDCKK
jgi:hypothetical protein